MPRAPKPATIRQNTERVDVGMVPADTPEDTSTVPPSLRHWLASTKRSWERFWGSPGRHVTILSLDLDMLERLWTLYDDRERAHRELRKARVVTGSQGQDRPSGFYTVIARLDAEIRQLEDRVSKSARSRLTLGMTVGDGDRGRAGAPEGGRPDAGSDPRPDDEGRPDELEEPVRDPRLYIVDRRAG